MRRFFVVALILAASSMGPASLATAATPAKALGEAFRAFEEGKPAAALRLSKSISTKRLINDDYRAYLRGQSHYLLGDYGAALKEFRALSKMRSSRFVGQARWRSADCLWQQGAHSEAAKSYKKLLQGQVEGGEDAIARFRMAKAMDLAKQERRAIEGYREFLRQHPAHVLSKVADRRLRELGDGGIAGLSARDRIRRAEDLVRDKKWEIAVAELAELDRDAMDEATQLDYDFWRSMALFKRRRHYDRAGKTFLSIYPRMGDKAAEAMFHGARALSRADFDTRAIEWYQKLTVEYPRSTWAAEAQFLSGWLEFNRGNYAKALPYLRPMKKRYPKSRFTKETPWYQGMSHFMLGHYAKALPYFETVAKQGGKEIGGKGLYWKARALQKLDKAQESQAIYRQLVTTYPFSWYALLSRSRLAAQGIEIGPFGDKDGDPSAAPALDDRLDKKLAADPLIRKANELIEAGLLTEAGDELFRGERSFLDRHKRKRSAALAILLDAYRRAENFNRPWMLAVVHGGRRALDVEPKGTARRWWQHAYPLAYRELVEKYLTLGKIPDYYLYTIMRKESGFNPHTHSYADAQGLLQMIPPTTERVAPELGLTYTEDLLFDPELNIQTGAWYIGRLLQKFRGQIPVGAGSFNAGPRAVMRWLTRNGDKPMDEYVELASYRQTRNYMKRTTETYARYKYLYDGEIYEQPLELNADFVVNHIDY